MDIKELMARERWATEEAYIRGNVDALDEVFAPDAVFHIPPFWDFKGLELFKQNAATTSQTFTDIRWNWDEVIIEGNTAVHRYTVRMKHTGVSPTIPVSPTGKEVVLEGCAVYHVKDDKIVEFFGYDDYLGSSQQLGIIPPIGQQ